MSHPNSNTAIIVSSAFGQAQQIEGLASNADLLVRFRLPSRSASRTPLNLSLAIDVSGSMAGAPLKHAILAAQRVVDALDPNDTFSVVLYDDTVRTLIEPTRVTDKEALKSQIASARAGGLTNLSGGWLKAVELVQQHVQPEVVSRVLLLTDGQANVGITQSNVLIKTAEQKAESGVTTTTLGFGSYFNEDLLIGIARAAGGNFYFIQSADDASDVFTFELQTMKAVAAQNLTVTLQAEAGVNLGQILSLHRAAPKSASDTAPNSLTVELGDMHEDEDKLLGLQVNWDAFAGGVHPLLNLTYSAEVLDEGSVVTATGDTTITATFGPLDASTTADTSVTLDLARLRIAHAKERALERMDAGFASEAGKTLRTLIQDLTSSGLNEHFEIAEELEQLEHFASRMASRNLDNETRKEIRDQSFQGRAHNHSHLQSRGVTVDAAVMSLPVVQDASSGVELECVRQGGKLRLHAISPGYDSSLNVQFPRALRAEGAHYLVGGLESSADGSFYRVTGDIQRLVRSGEADPLQNLNIGSNRPRRVTSGASSAASAAVTKAAKTAADLETTDNASGGILVQCVKDGSKLRARVVQDGYEPDWNMRFPRSIREEGFLYVVDEVNTAPDGKSYIASGAIKRFIQPN
jgi:Ca-activated chloride channel family protein